jgi:hypothetical protein
VVGAGLRELLAREHDERPFGTYGEWVTPPSGPAEPPQAPPPAFEIPPADWVAEDREREARAESEAAPEPQLEPKPEPPFDAQALRVELSPPPWAESEKPLSGQRGQKARRRRRRAKRRQARP